MLRSLTVAQMSKPLLPPNASELERAAAAALAEIEHVPIPLRDLWNPDTCPEHLLPYLAWSFSVDRWDDNWTEEVKRDVVRNSFFVHQRKGTIAALRRVVEPLGYIINVVEWWEVDPPGEPGTFTFSLGLEDSAISEEIYAEVDRLISEAKPLTRHIRGSALARSVFGFVYVGAAITSGETTTIYPGV